MLNKATVLLLASSLTLFACGEKAAPEQADAATTLDATTTPDAANSACTYTGFTPERAVGERDTELDVLFYSSSSGQEPNVQQLSLDLYFPFGANPKPHTLTFDGENLQTCHSCFLVRRDCNASSCISGKVFLAQEGTAELTSLGAIGERLQGTIRNAVLSEVTIEAELLTVLVPNGETWCIDDYSFDVEVVAPQ